MKIPHLPKGHSFVSLSAVPMKSGISFFALDRTGGIWHLPPNGDRWEDLTAETVGPKHSKGDDAG